VKRFFETCPEFPKDFPNGTIRNEKVARIMRRVHYAGYVERPQWNLSLRKGHLDVLVALETWQAVQDRLDGGRRAPAWKDFNADFPLRGFFLCGDCGNPLTANLSKSKTGKKHPYYLCFNKGCGSHRKSIRRNELEGVFADFLKELQPSETLSDLTKAMFRTSWDQRMAQARAGVTSLKRDVAKQIDGLLDRIVEASLPSVGAAYEKRLAKLETEKLVVEEKLAKGVQPKHGFDELFARACQCLATPWKLWESRRLTLCRTGLELAFTGRISYCRKTRLRTPETTLPFKVLGGLSGQKCLMAERGSASLLW